MAHDNWERPTAKDILGYTPQGDDWDKLCGSLKRIGLPKNKWGVPIDTMEHCPKCDDRTKCQTRAFGNPCYCLNCFGYGQMECTIEICPIANEVPE